MNQTHTVSWSEARALALDCLATINQLPRIHSLPGQPYRAYPIPKGGIHAVQLFDSSEVVAVEFPHEADFFFDDIIDSGKTRKDTASQYGQKPFLALVDKTKPSAFKGWVKFPWEVGEAVEAEDNVRRLLQVIGENPDREGLIETPKRFVKALKELTAGYGENPADHLRKSFSLQDTDEAVGHYDELILSGPLPFVSLCEHHLALFEGHAWIGYLPRKEGRVVGLSKLARLLDGYAKRLQVQERLTLQIANDIERELSPEGVAVVLKARHTCQCARGVKKDGRMITSAMRGLFRNEPSARNELMDLIRLTETKS